MNYIIQADTDIGNVKQTNQDSMSVKAINTPAGRMVFGIMCDGMGGLEKGELASASVVNAFNKWIQEKLIEITEESLTDNYIREEWSNIVVTMNEKIKIYGKKSGVNLGTTLTAMLVTEQRYYVINVGDTRAYGLNRTGMQVITKDQTVVAREVEQGIITEEQAAVDSRRSVLLQCIGASEKVYPDMFYGRVEPDTVFMLCTDGFRHVINEEEIYTYLQPDNMTTQKQMKSNIRHLIEIVKSRQERDNISVIAIKTY